MFYGGRGDLLGQLDNNRNRVIDPVFWLSYAFMNLP